VGAATPALVYLRKVRKASILALASSSDPPKSLRVSYKGLPGADPRLRG